MERISAVGRPRSAVMEAIPLVPRNLGYLRSLGDDTGIALGGCTQRYGRRVVTPTFR
jgi:hypothetical protein